MENTQMFISPISRYLTSEFINENINPGKLLRKAHELGVPYMPGNLFFPFRSNGDNLVRLCYGNVIKDELAEGIKRLSQAVRESRET